MRLSEKLIQEIIRKSGDKWILYTHDGKKKIGTHDSYASALAQEKAIQAHKHG